LEEETRAETRDTHLDELMMLWGKKSFDGMRSHPLISHMVDVAGVVQAMWDDVFQLSFNMTAL
jgi:hypothetical protein